MVDHSIDHASQHHYHDHHVFFWKKKKTCFFLSFYQKEKNTFSGLNSPGSSLDSGGGPALRNLN